MNNILFIDIEPYKPGKIRVVGVRYGQKEYHGKDVTKVKDWINEAHFICGHNIIAYDIPILKKRLGAELFEGKKIIDTLLWSPLLFAERPYHKLVKGYQLVNEQEASNPLSDSKLAKDLLLDELAAFNNLDRALRDSYYHLLKDEVDYKAFFDNVNLEPATSGLLECIRALSNNGFCSTIDLSLYVSQEPIALSYALAILATEKIDSVLSFWVLHQIPRAQRILKELRFTDCGNSSCSHCTNTLDPTKALQQYFGFPSFRSFDEEEAISIQEQVVRTGLSKESLVAVFPTGGGKSLTFQLPALMSGELARQLTVVISPLVSLMKDQVDNLETKFSITRAVAINGLLSPLERQDAIEQVEDGRASLLYISPESLRSRTILRILKNRSVARFVIDEAHCFSAWGHDFRVDYLYIADFIKLLQVESGDMIPVSCFTATAKPQVIEDIQAYFSERLNLSLKGFISRAGRKNLMYEVIDITEEESKMKELLQLLDRCEKPAIVYASRTKKVVDIAQLISATGMSCTYFHGKLKSEEKIRNQNEFMSGNVDIIVATSAFGMGVDKEDVRTVIHFDISNSLENYTQEAGRAGRKEDIEAKCYILFREEDLNKHFSLIQQTKLNIKEIQEIWKAIRNQNKYRNRMSNSALQIAKKAGWDTELRELENRVTAAIAALEDRKFLKRSQNSPRVFANSLLVKTYDECSRIIRSSQKIDERAQENCIRVLQRIIKDEECRVDYLAEILSMRMSITQDAIQHLRELKILGDTKDLTAFVSLVRSRNGSRKILERMLVQEKALLPVIREGVSKTSYRQLNHVIRNSGKTVSSADDIRTIFDYWSRRKLIKKKRIDRVKNSYEIKLDNKLALESDVSVRHEVASACFIEIERITELKYQNEERRDDLLAEFSLLELLKAIEPFIGEGAVSTKGVERALLYLHHIGAIKLEGGFMVIFNKLNIEEIDSNRTRFTSKDYQALKDHYDHKVEQVHIVGEYAKKRLNNYQESLQYVDDYFKLPLDGFKRKYFSGRSNEIKRAVTIEKFQKLVGNLDIDQMAIHRSKKKNILVLAGPGSGKTKVLVHKIASLLILEDVKPEQFLMLTFSKSAAMEFRSRVKALIPEYARLIAISTFHGFCFDKLGQLGSLEHSEHIIRDCIAAIKNGDIDISSISNKSVLLLDEFQDVNAVEWELIQLIREKAENIRVIAIGDDDQNIFSFRGASIEYMRAFQDQFEAKTFALTRNYRSRAGIVAFNNKLLDTIHDRLKETHLEAVPNTGPAEIKVVEYAHGHLFAPLIDDLISQAQEGTSAVLARTNKEALMVATLLEQRGVSVQLNAGYEGFRLIDLYEIRVFDTMLGEKAISTGILFRKGWNSAREMFAKRFSKNKHFGLCAKVLDLFEGQMNESVESHEWKDYISQISAQDVIHADKDTIMVSTMHKSKGKEFDNVYLLLEDFKVSSDDERRLLYVSSTRAKRSLHIHINSTLFTGVVLDELDYHKSDMVYEPPTGFEVILGHKDMQLNSYKYAQGKINGSKTEDPLIRATHMFGENEALGLSLEASKTVLLFSKRYQTKKHEKYNKSGYEIKGAKIEYKVYWYDKKDEKEYLIVLPRVLYGLEQSG